MSLEQWTDVDNYLGGSFAPHDAALQAALEVSAEAGLPDIQVSPLQGGLLAWMARSLDAKSILELGTLGGYSTIWLARALPADGRLVTLESNPRHAEIARRNIAVAGLSEIVDLRVGAALETLPTLAQEDPFDLVFIDADKPNTPEYFSWAVRLSHPGSVILVDNVVRNGELINAASDDPSVQAMRRLIDQLAADPRVDSAALQTVGSKGYDGLILARVR
ncbi:MAG: O-methyltransferase [Planctomycetaceae bacterium]